MPPKSDPGYTEHLLSFCDALRDRGVPVTTDNVASAARALAAGDPLDRDAVYYGLKATLVSDPGHIEDFDALFEAWWPRRRDRDEEADIDEIDESGTTGGSRPSSDDADEDDRERERPQDGPQHDSGRDPDDDRREDRRGDHRHRQREREVPDREFDVERIAEEFGDRESSARPEVQDSNALGADDDLPLLVRELGEQLGTLADLETQASSTGRLDLRRALSQSRVRAPDSLPRVRDRRTAVSIRLFVDVSRSMLRNVDPVFLFRFLSECVRQYVDPRVYFFDTSATEVTGHFKTADLAQTVTEMCRAQTEWGAGTTIGRCLEDVLVADPFVVDGDTVTVIVSDGWDAGDLDRLADQLATIESRGRMLVWLNPLATSDAYEPKVGGMATALPYVDALYGFASADDLHRIVRDLRSRTPAMV